MYQNYKVSVVFPAFNEEENIRSAIEEFFLHPSVDELIAVDNNSTDRTKEEILRTRAKYIFEEKPGYGAALMRGMREASGDVIITVEPDGTFTANDLDKLLIYSKEFDVVLGTRTSRALIWSGAYMPFWVRLGNWAVAKMLEYLFNGPTLTDVGCSFKLIKRLAYDQIKDKLTVQGSVFSPDLMIQILKAKLPCVEVPVHYKRRIGESKITGNNWRTLKVGMKMIWFIASERVNPSK